MKLSEMETALKRFGFDSSDPLKQWLNSALHSIEADHDWPFLEGVPQNFSTTRGQKTLTITSFYNKVIGIRDLTNGRKLEWYNMPKFLREIENPKEESKPQIYLTPAGTIYIELWPVPDGVYEMLIYTQQQAKDMSAANDEPETLSGNKWPIVTHWAIVLKAAIIALFAENEEERAKQLTAEFDKEIEKLRKYFNDRTLDEAQTVEDVMGYGSSYVGGVGY